MDVNRIREDFPILKREREDGKKLIYFDNAATSLKPRQVVEAISEFYNKHCANVHRGAHTLSREASQIYEDAHDLVSKFIGARDFREVVFVKNTTEAINTVAFGLDWKDGDEVIITGIDHHSNLLPWMVVKGRYGVKLKIVRTKADGSIDVERILGEVSDRTRVVSLTYVSNVLGTIVHDDDIRKIKDEGDFLLVLDGAQAVPHIPVDVRELKCDFLAFSAHKMLGPMGIGVLYVREDVSDDVKPLIFGGSMIKKVSFDGFELAEMPWRLEGGTPNVGGAAGFSEAVKYLNKLGMENVREHEKRLTEYALKGMKEIDGVETYGPEDINERSGVIPFNLRGIGPHEVAVYLDSYAFIEVRSGLHCAEPLHRSMGLSGTVRASFYIYNTLEEVDVFLRTLEEISGYSAK
ncbi:MAG: aminotransferase class V-fold PLP-dependent enzyme [Candidatus Asgardarchaeia archaeon]